MKWVILRGLTREIGHWRDFHPLLEEASDGVCALDLPGIGTEKNRSCPLTIKGNTEDLRERWLEFKNAQGEPGGWGILGISMGGMIAMDWVHRYPHDFNRIVVINSSSSDSGSHIQRFSLFGWYHTVLSLMKRNPEASEREILRMVSNLKKDDAQIIQDFGVIAKNSDLSFKKIASQLMASSQFLLPPSIKVPMLVLASLKDHLVDVRCSKIIAEKYKAQIKFHPTAGHDLTLDDPHWCRDRIVDGAETIPSRRSEEDSTHGRG